MKKTLAILVLILLTLLLLVSCHRVHQTVSYGVVSVPYCVEMNYFNYLPDDRYESYVLVTDIGFKNYSLVYGTPEIIDSVKCVEYQKAVEKAKEQKEARKVQREFNRQVRKELRKLNT